MISVISIAVVWLLAAIVIVASICRLTMLQKKSHKPSWALMYILFGAFAIDTAFSARELLVEHDAHTFLGLVALAVNVIVTAKSWRGGAPDLSKKDAA